LRVRLSLNKNHEPQTKTSTQFRSQKDIRQRR